MPASCIVARGRWLTGQAFGSKHPRRRAQSLEALAALKFKSPYPVKTDTMADQVRGTCCREYARVLTVLRFLHIDREGIPEAAPFPKHQGPRCVHLVHVQSECGVLIAHWLHGRALQLAARWLPRKRGGIRMLVWASRPQLRLSVALTLVRVLAASLCVLGLIHACMLSADKKCPFTGDVSIRGRILTGRVVSTKMTRTIIIRRDYLHYIPKYST